MCDWNQLWNEKLKWFLQHQMANNSLFFDISRARFSSETENDKDDVNVQHFRCSTNNFNRKRMSIVSWRIFLAACHSATVNSVFIQVNWTKKNFFLRLKIDENFSTNLSKQLDWTRGENSYMHVKYRMRVMNVYRFACQQLNRLNESASCTVSSTMDFFF